MLKRIVGIGPRDQYRGSALVGCVIDVLQWPGEPPVQGKYSMDSWCLHARLVTSITPLPDGVAYNEHNKGFYFIDVELEDYQPPEEKEYITMRSPESIRKEILKYVENLEPERIKPIPSGLRGKLVSEFNCVFGGSVNRYHVIGWIFSGSFDKQMQTKDLTDAQIAGLLHWIELKHTKEGWTVGKAFYSEATLVYAYVAQGHVRSSNNGARIAMQIPTSLIRAIK